MKAEYANSDVLAEEAREKFLSREMVPLWAGRQGWRRGSAPVLHEPSWRRMWGRKAKEKR